MIANYADRVEVHPDRYGSVRQLPPTWIVIHTSEGSNGPDAAEQLAQFLTRPGDRVTASGSRYGSSYHAIIDLEQVIPAVVDARVAYSAPGANTNGLHVVLPGRAGQTRQQWLSEPSLSRIDTLGKYFRDLRQKYGIPLERVTPAEMVAGTRGYCDHAAVRDAFGKTDHWDVGPNFPWDVLASKIRETPTPTGETMQPINRRMSDTRKYGPGGRMTPGVPLRLELPQDVKSARACQISAAVVEPSAPGYLTAAGALPLPVTSFCNYSADTLQGTTIIDVIDGSIYVQASSECFLVVDIQAIWT
jgi:hypothetical protein